MSKSFDNGMVCASEQAVIIDKEIYDEFVEEFKSYHTYFVNKEEKRFWKNSALVQKQQAELRWCKIEPKYCW